MHRPAVPAIARVECRSEGRGDETPVAVIFGNEVFEIVEILDRVVMTSAVAGDPVRDRYWVALVDGRRCQLMRQLPDGEWRVTLER